MPRPSLADHMLLFDLSTDPLESKDLAKASPDIVMKLKQLVVSKKLSCMCYQCGFQRTSAELLV